MEIKIDNKKLSDIFNDIIQKDNTPIEQHKELIQTYSKIINTIEEEMFKVESKLNNNNQNPSDNEGEYQIHL